MYIEHWYHINLVIIQININYNYWGLWQVDEKIKVSMTINYEVSPQFDYPMWLLNAILILFLIFQSKTTTTKYISYL